MTARNSALRLVPLTPELERLISAADRDPLMQTWAGAKALQAQRCNGPGCAVLQRVKGAGETPIGAGGLVPIWPGHAEAWLAIMDDVGVRQLVPALRLAAGWLADMQRLAGYRRVQAFIRWSAPWRVSFAAALGFEPEGRMRAWGPDGADYGCYVRIAPARRIELREDCDGQTHPFIDGTRY